MKKKYLVSSIILPIAALAVIGAGTASAHGFGGMLGSKVAPDEIAQRQQAKFQSHAELLGISIDEVKAAWAKGESLQQLAQEKGINEDQLKQKLQDARKQQMQKHMQALVDKGVITQAQADQRMQFIQQKTASFMGKGMHFMGHRGGFGF